MDATLLFKFGALGIIVLLIGKVMESSGKRDMALMVELAGSVIGMLMLITLIVKLFNSLKVLFPM